MNKPNSAAAMLALFSFLSTPVAATEQTRGSSPRGSVNFGDAASIADDDGMMTEWRRGARFRRDRGIDLGDVITGVLIVGGIVIAADAARDAGRERDERERDYEYDRRELRYADRYGRSVSPSEAAETCMSEAEQFGTVGDFDLVRRVGDGWRVEGRMDDGAPFACEIDADGRVRELGSSAAAGAPYTDGGDAERDAQGDAGADIDYAAARARQGGYAYGEEDDRGGALYPGGEG